MPDSISHEIDALFARLKQRADQRAEEDQQAAHAHAAEEADRLGDDADNTRYRTAYQHELDHRRHERSAPPIRKLMIQGRVYVAATRTERDVYICQRCEERTVNERLRCWRCGPVTPAGWPLREESARALSDACRNWDHLAAQPADSESEPGPAARERQELDGKISRLHHTGLSLREIARRVGVSKSTVERRLKEMGR